MGRRVMMRIRGSWESTSRENKKRENKRKGNRGNKWGLKKRMKRMTHKIKRVTSPNPKAA